MMPFRLSSLLTLLTMFLAGLFLAPQNLTASANEKYASIVIDMESGQVLHARNADAPRYPASLTKVMTLYMVFEALDEGTLALTDEMNVSTKAAKASPSKLGLRTGSTITVEQGINALVTKSANDVAVVIAEHLGGSESRFAALMTVKARSLGLRDTRFYNASGLPDARQVSTARDMAKLAEAMLVNHRDQYDYFSQRSFKFGRVTHRNHNRLLGLVDGVDGIKTGYTRASGFNLMSSAERDGNRVIVVMLGGRTSAARNAHVTDLLEAAFTAIEATAPAQPDLRTRIAFEAIRNPAPKGASPVLMDMELEQGSREEGSAAN